MLTFYELVVVILQSRALLSHACCSTWTQGMGWAAAVVIAFVGLGVSQLLVRTHAGWHRAVLVSFDARQPTPNSSLARAPAGLLLDTAT